jgi:hypothetical protein
MIGSDIAVVCSAVTEDLKRTKFGGDFAAMLSWWQQNKVAEHAALDAANDEYPLP